MSLQQKPTTGTLADFRQRVARLQRLLVFTQEHVRALRKEFGVFWRARALETTLSGLHGPIIPFIVLLNDLNLAVGNADALLQTLHALPQAKAEEALASVDQEHMVALAKSLFAQAQTLRNNPAVNEALRQLMADSTGTVKSAAPETPRPAAEPSSAPALPNANRLKLEHFQLWSPGAPALDVPKPAPTMATKASAEFANKVKAFMNTLDLAKQVLRQVSPRMELMADAFTRTGVPEAPRPWPEVGAAIRGDAKADKLNPLQMHWLPKLGHLLLNDREAVRLGLQAVGHWRTATQLLEHTLVERDILLNTPPDRLPLVTQRLEPDNRLRNSVSWLSCLPVYAKILPVLADLFPVIVPDRAVTKA